MNRDILLSYCDQLLKVDQFKDYAPNGLQVEGKNTIQKVVTGVTASQALIDIAIEKKADAIMVHHGYFWKNEPVTITGMKAKRIGSLMRNNINLIGYHLPLDAHAIYGNNAQFAKKLDILDTQKDNELLRMGDLTQPESIDKFIARIEKVLMRKPLHLKGQCEMVKTVAWCSGGAQNYHEQAVEMGADIYITGEVSEQNTHIARETGVDFVSAGHHATETLGIQALGAHLATHFSIEVEFVDVMNPV